MSRSLLLLCALALAGCADGAIQTTSGEAYLRAAGPAPVVDDPVLAFGAAAERAAQPVSVQALSVDAMVRRSAAVEPLLGLPARLGVARIENGRLTLIPAREAALWEALRARRPEIGAPVPVDPFIADQALRAALPGEPLRRRVDARNMLALIRVGAARQHLDAVLIYEVGRRGGARGADAARLRDLMVLGGQPLSAAKGEALAVARAALIDVRNGYPYAAASAEAPFPRSEWWRSDGAAAATLGEATTAATEALIPKVESQLAALIARRAARAEGG